MNIKERITSPTFLWFILTITLTFTVSIIIDKILKFIIKRTFKKIKLKNDNSRILSFENIFISFSKYLIYTLAIIFLITKYIGPIPITMASLGAAILGFGSQSIIKDIFSGIFINFENQMSIGDHITINNIEGIVESIEIRVIKIRGFNGDLHTIPNGGILFVTNHSNGPQRYEVFIQVSYETDYEKVNCILNNISDKFKEDSAIVELPKNIGISDFTERGVQFRIIGTCLPMKKIEIEAKLRKEILAEFNKKNIKFSFFKISINN